MSIFIVATPFRLRDLHIFRILLVIEAQLHCPEAKQLSRAQLCKNNKTFSVFLLQLGKQLTSISKVQKIPVTYTVLN